MKFTKFAAATAALSLISVPGMAQDTEATAAPETAEAPAEATAPATADIPVELAEGTSVSGNDGNPIGTVTMVNDQMAVVDTGSHQIPLPREAFGAGTAGPTLNITKAELDTSFAEQMAAAEAALNEKLIAGAEVKTADAQVLGTVESIDAENVLLTITGDKKVTLAKKLFAVGPEGGVIVRATLAQIEAAMGSGQAG